MNDQRVTIAIPTFNRAEMTIESFFDVYSDDRVDEIIIVDDASDYDIYEDLKSMTDALPKVKLYRNITNQDCYRNKMTAISFATNDWCILLDSDNKINKSYLDVIFNLPEWDNRTVYTPSFAQPHFNFTPYSGVLLSKEFVSEYIDKPMLEVCLNAANYLVNKNEYLKVWDGTVDPVTSDSIYQCYNWLKAGNKIYIVPNLKYEHRVHDGSHYQNNVKRTPEGFHESVLKKLRELK